MKEWPVPSVTLLDADGDVEPMAPAEPASQADAVLLPPNAPPLARGFPDAGQANWTMSWHIGEGGGACQAPPPVVATVVLGIVSGDLRLTIDPTLFRTDSRSLFVSCGHDIGVQSFAAYPPRSTDPLQHNYPVTATLALPATVRAGETLHFAVTLTNTGTSAAQWDSTCPTYTMALVQAKAGSAGYYLNCSGLGPILPMQSRTFAMELAIPPDAVPGAAHLAAPTRLRLQGGSGGNGDRHLIAAEASGAAYPGVKGPTLAQRCGERARMTGSGEPFTTLRATLPANMW